MLVTASEAWVCALISGIRYEEDERKSSYHLLCKYALNLEPCLGSVHGDPTVIESLLLRGLPVTINIVKVVNNRLTKIYCSAV